MARLKKNLEEPMKPIFTIHAGEYLVGDYLEKELKDCEIWVPAKDTGTDLLITNAKNRAKSVGIQVKFSKDFLPQMEATFHDSLLACGWWTLNQNKIVKSNAEIWVLAAYSFLEKKIQIIIIDPRELLKRLIAIHGNKQSFNVYLWVTKDGHCFETRGLKGLDQKKIIAGDYSLINKSRDYTGFLNSIGEINKKIAR